FLGREQPAGAVALRAKRAAHGPGSAAARTDVLQLQRDRFLAAVVDVAQREFDRRLQILTALRKTGALRRASTADAGEKHVEEIGEAARPGAARPCTEVAEVVLKRIALRAAIAALLFGLLRCFLPVAAQHVVFAPFVRVA